MQKKQEQLVTFFLQQGYLLSPDFIQQAHVLEQLSQDNIPMSPFFISLLSFFEKENIILLSANHLALFLQLLPSSPASSSFSSTPATSINSTKTSQESSEQSLHGVEVLFSYAKESGKREVGDFVQHFTKRYEAIESILRHRQELTGLTAIQRILGKKEKEQVSLIGIIKDKRETKQGNIILVLEDKTGEISVIVNKNKPEVYEEAKNTVLDEVIGIVGFSADRAVFCTSIILPDIPLYHELKKSPEEEYAIFLSDLHVGSKLFLQDDFERFLQWLRGDLGNEKQRELVKKIKYVFIMGDIVDGVGIYPNQESELAIHDIYKQYIEAARLLSRIPEHMTLIISPGNHDAIRLSEPQPAFDPDFAKPLLQLKHALFVSNPSMVTIGKKQHFPGFDVLLYHGYSFDYYIAEIDSIRNNGGYDRADLVMKFLLRRRHLAPTHGSSLYLPDTDEDHLVIKRIPDIFATGHLHKTCISQYKHITLLCGSCWQSKTTFQEKVGHHPEPSRVPLINLQTREVKVLKFGDA